MTIQTPNRPTPLVLPATCALAWLAVAGHLAWSAEARRPAPVFARENLVAWCIVPFDAAKRGPDERAEMVARLGLRRVAYDWRDEHVPTFEAEILAYKRHGLEYFAFWSWHPDMAGLIDKHGIRPQIWQTNPSPSGEAEAKVRVAGRQLLPLAEQARKLGCKLGLYNHGGWGGEPENLVAVCRWLRAETASDHVGIVYNLHHGHAHVPRFSELLTLMQPYLFCLNLNGMNDDEKPKILPLGQGQHDVALLKIIAESGYTGPIGIIDHRGDTDAEEALRANLDGLKKVLKELGDTAALETYQ